MKIKACKTSMYKLASDYTRLPIMKRTRYYKTPRSASYYLEWMGGRAFLSPVFGKPLISITTEDEPWKVYQLSIPDLLNNNMILFDSDEEERSVIQRWQDKK